MNRSIRKTNAANASGLRTWARQLLQAFADAGQPSGAGLRLHVGPNGVLVWAEAPQADRSEPYVAAVLTIPEKSAAPVDGQSIGAEEPAETPVYASM
jgi:hypothetical protein